MAADDRNVLASRLTLIGGIVGLLFAIAVLVSLSRRVDRLEDRLATSQQSERLLQQQLDGAEQRAGRTLSEAEAAKDRAYLAAQATEATRAERSRAEWDRELAREMADRARLESRLAAAEADRSQTEVEQIQQARRRELDRMQRALGAIVETERTPLGMVMRLGEESLQFDFDKATIRGQDKELLSRIAGVLLASRGYHLYIDGHTDDQGPAAYNKHLSGQRAESVKRYFVDAGLPEPIIEVRGYGESNPRAKGTAATARQRNRRVEIGVVDTIIDYEADQSGRNP